MPRQLYYVAILCPDTIEDNISIHKNWMREAFGCKVALKSPAHITLIPPFLIEPSQEKDLLEILSTFRQDTGGMEIQLRHFDHFGQSVVFAQVVPNEGLTALQLALEQHMVRHPELGIREELRPFHPHVTIANRDLRETDFPHAWAHFERLEFEATFTIQEFSLMQFDGNRWLPVGTFAW